MAESDTQPETGQPAGEPAVELAPQVSAAKPTPVGRAGSADEQPRGELTAATLGRLMGLATTSELKLLEGKIDLMASKLNNIMVRVDRMVALFNAMPTGADLERVDVQIGALKSLIRDTLTQLAGKELPNEQPPAKKTGTNIVSNETGEGDTATSSK